jgi:hypothetical protein
MFLLFAALLSLQCKVQEHTVTSREANVTVAERFRYVGGQRFVLRDVADAEQHLYVVAGPSGEITELLWLQFEHYLPTVPGTNDYKPDRVTRRNGVDFFTSLRRYSEAPQPGSDRRRAFDLLAEKGYRTDKLSARVRLVHLPSDDRRSEVMIIYSVPGDANEELVEQALRTFTLRAPD